MLDFYLKWFIVLMVNFLVLIFVLNKILFQPILKIFGERATRTTGFINTAREMDERKEALLGQMKQEYTNAGHKARTEYDAQRLDGIDKQREALSKANTEAMAIIEKARQELKAEADRARVTLRGDVEKLSDSIVSKVAGI